ncbi:MAG: hypothetical protein JWO02_2320 [Solirubrobacterales bacterium]|nr:hypothetical protein [Solirubrobacterales bacterium]
MAVDDPTHDEARIRVLELQMESMVRRALLLVILSGVALTFSIAAFVIAL